MEQSMDQWIGQPMDPKVAYRDACLRLENDNCGPLT